nr:glycosyltransferase [Mucilaginibacter sp. L294]
MCIRDSFKIGVNNYLKNNEENYDLLWIASAEAALRIGHLLDNKKYVLNIYELYDKAPKYKKYLKPIAQKAVNVIVPEINRANILKVWLELKHLPSVVPNKPLIHPLKKNIIVPEFADILNHPKIIIYQGAIGKDRNLDSICEAVNSMPDYRLLLLGKKTDYFNELKAKFKNIYHIGFVTPPLHLYITSNCYIGIVTYSYYSLNTIFCAPNKIWEYSGFSLPMLANNIPGLINTVGHFGAGVCIDMDNVQQIKNAIEDIDNNYQKYQEASYKMFFSIDVKEKINKIAKQSLNI